MDPLHLLCAALWSFFGVRRRADAARDLEGVPPHMIIAVGVIVAAILVIGIVVVVRLIIGKSSAPLPVEPAVQSGRRPALAAAKPRAGSRTALDLGGGGGRCGVGSAVHRSASSKRYLTAWHGHGSDGGGRVQEYAISFP